jgi:conjugal transfer pilus assembly protein TraB
MNTFQEKFRSFWDALGPQQKRWGSIIVAVAIVMLFMSFVVDSGEPKKRIAHTNKKQQRSVLTDVNTRAVGMDAISSKIKMISRENERLMKEMTRMRDELSDQRARRGNDPHVMQELERLQKRVAILNEVDKKVNWKLDDMQSGKTIDKQIEHKLAQAQFKLENLMTDNVDNVSTTRQNRVMVDMDKELATMDPNEIFEAFPTGAGNTDETKTKKDPVTGAKTTTTNSNGPMVIQTMSQPEVKVSIEDQTKALESYLPAGSIISGVLLSGLDAPTGESARQEPFPVIMRVQSEAILPNQFTADIKECFMLLSGYGELSSERVYLRGEAFSCVREDGKIIETALNSYGVGLDGKAGIRGVVRSKQGQLIGKSMLAGFMGGVAEALDQNPIPVIQTDPSSTPLFQSALGGDALTHGASSGASEALTKIADFYLDLAESTLPVIELNSGTEIDVVVTKGAKLVAK